jgi:hypothetical protein
MDYSARYYDSALGRFVSADTVVPNPRIPQDWNRYEYVRNRPLMYVDPTGHRYRPPIPPGPRKEFDTTGWGFFAVVYHVLCLYAPNCHIEGTYTRPNGTVVDGPSPLLDVYDPGKPFHSRVVWNDREHYAQSMIDLTTMGFAYTAIPVNGISFVSAGSLADDAVPSQYNQYSVLWEMEMEPEKLGMSRTTHRRAFWAEFDRQLEADPEFGRMFGDLDRSQWRVHHDAIRPTVLQLVPKQQHSFGSAWDAVLHPGGAGGWAQLAPYRTVAPVTVVIPAYLWEWQVPSAPVDTGDDYSIGGGGGGGIPCVAM